MSSSNVSIAAGKIDPVKIFILFIFTAGVVLRLVPAIYFPIWLDEASYFFISQNSIQDLVFLNHWNDSQPPFYPLILHFLQIIDGNEFFLRLPSVFFSAVTLIYCYKLGNRLVNRTFGLIVLIIFSFSNLLISLSWQANVYSLVIMFTLISVYYYFFKLKSRNSGLFLFFINISGFLSDYSFAWLIISFTVFEAVNYIFIYGRKSIYYKEKFINLIVLISNLLFLLIWGLITLKKIPHALALADWLSKNEIIQNALISFAGVSIFFDIKSVLFILFMILGIYAGIKFFARKNKEFVIFISILIFLPFTSTLIFSLFYQPILLARHLNAVGIGLYISLAFLIYYARNIISVVILAFFVFLSLISMKDYTRMNVLHIDWKDISRLINRKISSENSKGAILLDIDDKQFHFQPLTYYLNQYHNLNLELNSDELIRSQFPAYYLNKYYKQRSMLVKKRIIIPPNSGFYLNPVKESELYTLWFFNFTGEKEKLEKIVNKFDCRKITDYSSMDVFITQCSL